MPYDPNRYTLKVKSVEWKAGDKFTGYRAEVEVLTRTQEQGASVGESVNLWFSWTSTLGSWAVEQAQVEYRAFICACAGQADSDVDDDQFDAINAAIIAASEQESGLGDGVTAGLSITNRVNKNGKTIAQRLYHPAA